MSASCGNVARWEIARGMAEARAAQASANEGLIFRQGKNVARPHTAASMESEAKQIGAGGLL
jgi:hypothetical protein